MKRIAVLVIFLLLMNHTAILNAQGLEKEYTVFDKFSRGLYNAATFYFEIPITIYEVSVEENPLLGILYGMPLGFAKAIIRMTAAAIEITTSPLPPFEPIVEPEYLFFQSGMGEEKERD